MRNFILLLFLSGCFQSYNSNTQDKNLFNNNVIDTSTPAGQRFSAAYTILVNKCANCHTSQQRHAHWASFTEENDWFTSEEGQVLVESNSSLTSAIIYRLKTWGEIGGMPEGPETISEDEYNTLRDWIDNIGL